MVIDTSAVLAILLVEPRAELLAQAIEADPVRLLSTVSHLEGAIVLAMRTGPAGLSEYDEFVRRAITEIVPFDADQSVVAREAYLTFGKGIHPARLNFGDCCAYALAKQRGEALLYVGDDFAKTDVAAVPY